MQLIVFKHYYSSAEGEELHSRHINCRMSILRILRSVGAESVRGIGFNSLAAYNVC